MSGTTGIHTCRDGQREQACAVYTERHSGGERVQYRGFTVQKEPVDETLAGTWRLRNDLGEPVAIVDIDEFESPTEWLQFLDAVVHPVINQASSWVDIPHERKPRE